MIGPANRRRRGSSGEIARGDRSADRSENAPLPLDMGVRNAARAEARLARPGAGPESGARRTAVARARESERAIRKAMVETLEGQAVMVGASRRLAPTAALCLRVE